jgi:hypothetical protein
MVCRLSKFVEFSMETIFPAISRWAITAIMALFPIFAIMASIDFAINTVFMGVFFKIKQKCISSEKTVYENLLMVKSYGK